VRALLVILWCLVAGGASAVGLQDLGAVTRDPATGLDWLDLTQSLGLSYDDVENGVGNDLAAQGWRHATASEVCALFATYALAPEPCGVDNRTASQPSTGAVESLIDLLGDTGSVIGVSSTPPYDPVVTGSVGLLDDGDGTQAVGEGSLGHNLLNGDEETSVFVNWITAITVNPTTGHFLVRPAPEPAGGPAAAIILLVLAALRRGPRCRRRTGVQHAWWLEASRAGRLRAAAGERGWIGVCWQGAPGGAGGGRHGGDHRR
jgi:hypothetical protein